MNAAVHAADQGRGFEAVVIGGSAGGLDAVKRLLARLPVNYGLSVVVVLHVHPDQDGYYIEHLGHHCALPVSEAVEREPVLPGHVHVAVPGYHLLLETDRSFSFSAEEKVNFARPSIDVLFESAAEAYLDRLVGVILTGANHDGAHGLRKIKSLGGLCVVQQPDEAEHPQMPKSAIAAAAPQHVLGLDEMATLLAGLKPGMVVK